MSAPAPLSIPGYVWDGKRFYKAGPNQAAAPHAVASLKRSTSPPPRRTKRKPTPRRPIYPHATSLHDQLSNLALRQWNSGPSLNHQIGYISDIESKALSKFASTTTIYPECFPIDEEIQKLSFDSLNPNILRLGGSSGTLATGNLDRSNNLDGQYYPNDEFGFRTTWYARNKITSLESCHDRVMRVSRLAHPPWRNLPFLTISPVFSATCLGPPAQAIISTTSHAISLASVTLSPRKTSLWTSAISPSLIALGCDKKVLISGDPEMANSRMEGIQTGSKSTGDGTVFSLDLHHLEIYIDTPVTNIKLIKQDPYRVILAGMNGSLGAYDLRFPASVEGSGKPRTTTPVVSFKGHTNHFSTELGFDTWNDQFLVAAGQDSRVRLWSLKTGRQILPRSPPDRIVSSTTQPTLDLTSSSSLSPSVDSSTPRWSPSVLQALESLPASARATHRTPTHDQVAITGAGDDENQNESVWLRRFDNPIKAIRFSPLDPIYSFDSSTRRRMWIEGRDGSGEGGGIGERWVPKSLWIANGAGIECFGL
ncbi:uncharacterized protein JCM15063_004546 [Sporobolomyces koalae]|uniref:uncharacterized protein n=1 Tax=Sporobolomyces koalae TaxID=500713 RepID=UPI003171F648